MCAWYRLQRGGWVATPGLEKAKTSHSNHNLSKVDLFSERNLVKRASRCNIPSLNLDLSLKNWSYYIFGVFHFWALKIKATPAIIEVTILLFYKALIWDIINYGTLVSYNSSWSLRAISYSSKISNNNEKCPNCF